MEKGWKSTLASQRARFLFWSPIILLLLWASIESTSYAHVDTKFSTAVTVEEDGENVTTINENNFSLELRDDSWLELNPMIEQMHESEELDNFSKTFSQNIPVWIERDYVTLEESVELEDDNDAEVETLLEIAEEIDGYLGYIMWLTIAVLLMTFVQHKIPINPKKGINNYSLSGVILLGICFLGLACAGTINSNLGKGVNEYIGEDVFDEIDEEDLFGEGTFEDSGELFGGTFETDGTINWGPGLAFWLIILLSIVSGTGAVAQLSYLRKEDKIKDAPTWFKQNDAPEWFDKSVNYLPIGLFALGGLCILIASVSSWYTIDQTYMGWQPGADDDLGNASTHEISWGLSPWSVSYTNDSVFEDGRINATISSSSDSHDEQPFLSDTSTAVLDIRWTMLFSALICLWVAGICLVPMWREQISVRFDTWLVIGAALAVFMLQFGAAEFEDNMRDVAEKDVKRIAPSWNMVFTKSFVLTEDSFFGFDDWSFNQDFEDEDDSVSFYVQMQWGPSTGYYAANLAKISLIFGLFCYLLPKYVDQTYKKKPKYTYNLADNGWKDVVSSGMLIGMVFLSAMGSGLGDSLLDPTNAAAEGMYKWDVDSQGFFTNTEVTETTSTTHSQTYDASALYSENLTTVSIFITCDEGPSANQGDETDEMNYQVTIPAGVDSQGQSLEGTINCEGGGVNLFFESDWSVPNNVWAVDEQGAIDQAVFDLAYKGSWGITLEPIVNGGECPPDGPVPNPFQPDCGPEDEEDDGLRFQYIIDLNGRTALEAEKDDF